MVRKLKKKTVRNKMTPGSVRKHTNLALGKNKEPLDFSVKAALPPSDNNGKKTCCYTLVINNVEIKGIATGSPASSFQELLKQNSIYRALPGAVAVCKRTPNRKYPKHKELIKNSQILYLNEPSKVELIGPVPGTSRSSNTNPLQEVLNNMERKQKSSFVETIEGVELIGGSVKRYIGCATCTRSIRAAGNCKCRKVSGGGKKRICYVIKDITIRKDRFRFPSQTHEDLVCFDKLATKILGKQAGDYRHDLEADELFGSTIKNLLFDVQLKGEWNRDYKCWNLVIQDVTPKPRAGADTPNSASAAVTLTTNSDENEDGDASSNRDFEYDARSFPSVQAPAGGDDDDSGSDQDIEYDANPFNIAGFQVIVERGNGACSTSRNKQVGSCRCKGICNCVYTVGSNIPSGLVLIINNNFPGQSARERTGSMNDVLHLKQLFEQLNCQILETFDVNSSDLDNVIQEFQGQLVNSNAAFSFVVTMSHGVSNELEMADGRRINLFADIIYKFNDLDFPGFAGKPKIFIFQACQSFDSITARPLDPGMNCCSDILVCMPNSPGFLTPRRSTGSPYIRSIVEVFMKHARDTDLEEMLKIVQGKFRHFRVNPPGPNTNITEINMNDKKKPKKQTSRSQLPCHTGLLFSKRFYFNIES